MYLEEILDTRERIVKITNQFRIERQIRKGIGRAGVLRQACRQEQTKERWGKLAEKHVEREAWLETHKETKGLGVVILAQVARQPLSTRVYDSIIKGQVGH